jgi:glycosyltransferase involved in cell wall biosynthesis
MTAESYTEKSGPLVTVLVPTYNRRTYLPAALLSVLRQDYSNLEVFVIRDGGEEVRDVVESFNDDRIIFIDRNENRGIPFTLNEALADAGGEYVCYLGDDDLYYRHHVGTLLNALEAQTDCQVAYTDLYRTYCRIEPDGKRKVLSKVLEVSRDFDRFVMLYFNHTLHVSLMHRKDLLDKTGPYNEELNVLIDWDLTRKLSFFSDFHHIHEITGEYYSPVGESDRVSVRQRKKKRDYLRNVLTIRTTRPPKPWSKIRDLSIILAVDRLDEQASRTLSSVWRHTFYPYKVHLPLPQADLRRLSAEMPNIVAVPVDPTASEAGRIDAALARCDGEYVAVVPAGFPIREFWLEDSLYALINSPAGGLAFELEDSSDTLQAVVVSKGDLERARKSFPDLPICESLGSAGIAVRRLLPEEIPFQLDQLLSQARLAEKGKSWPEAIQTYEYMIENYQNELWLKSLAARVCFEAGRYDRAGELVRQVNRQRPTVDTLILEARLNRAKMDFSSAIELLERADRILEGKELVWT